MNTTRMMFGYAVLFILSCKGNTASESFSTLPGYELSNPVVINLKSELDEISGIVYYPKDSSVFAINDELGVLYKIYLREEIKIKRWKFSAESDYEDVELLDSTFYILQSNGNIDKVHFFGKDSVDAKTSTIPLQGRNDFESLYYDPTLGKLILVCKNCSMDSKESISAYSFDPASQTYSPEPVYNIDVTKIASYLDEADVKFKPSAVAISPISNDLYILSSVEKILVIAGRNGEVKHAISLNPRLFKQPEGISFAPSGDMFISNESAQVGAANILVYKYKPSN